MRSMHQADRHSESLQDGDVHTYLRKCTKRQAPHPYPTSAHAQLATGDVQYPAVYSTATSALPSHMPPAPCQAVTRKHSSVGKGLDGLLLLAARQPPAHLARPPQRLASPHLSSLRKSWNCAWPGSSSTSPPWSATSAGYVSTRRPSWLSRTIRTRLAVPDSSRDGSTSW